jgi:hypothetical protein
MISLIVIFVSLIVCSVTLLIFIGGVIFLLVSLNNPDKVSQAREGWIERRSDHDKQGW